MRPMDYSPVYEIALFETLDWPRLPLSFAIARVIIRVYLTTSSGAFFPPLFLPANRLD